MSIDYEEDFDGMEDVEEAAGWDNIPGKTSSEQSNEPMDEGSDPFSAEAGSASTSTGNESVGSGGFTKAQNISINKASGAFAISVEAPKGSPNKYRMQTLENDEGVACKAMQVFVGDGVDIGEDRGFFKKSVVYLTKPMQSAVNRALQEMGCKTTCGQYLEAYGDCTGGTRKESLACELIDTITGGFYTGKHEVTYRGRKANLKRISDSGFINWKKQGVVDIHPFFRQSAIDPSSWKVPNRYLYIHVAKFQPVPSDCHVPDLPDKYAGRTLKFTDWASKSFTIFEKAMAAAYAGSKSLDVLEVLTGAKRAEFDKWFQKCVLHIVLTPVPTKNFGDHMHPRFWSAIKKDRVTKSGGVKNEGLGISIYEAMQTREFAIAMTNNRNAKPYSEDDVETYWVDCCGDKAITKKDGRMVSIKDTGEVRKTR